MKTVKFKKGILYKIERFLFNYVDEPKDTCTLRSRWLKIILLSPFTLLNWIYLVLINKHDEDTSYLTAYNVLLKLVTFVIVFPLIMSILSGETGTIGEMIEAMSIIKFKIGILIPFLFSTTIIAIIVGIIVLIVFSIIELKEKIEDIRDERKLKKIIEKGGFLNYENSKNSIITTMYKSLKNKLCHKIEWIE